MKGEPHVAGPSPITSLAVRVHFWWIELSQSHSGHEQPAGAVLNGLHLDQPLYGTQTRETHYMRTVKIRQRVLRVPDSIHSEW